MGDKGILTDEEMMQLRRKLEPLMPTWGDKPKQWWGEIKEMSLFDKCRLWGNEEALLWVMGGEWDPWDADPEWMGNAPDRIGEPLPD